ncbi:MAG: ComF family protein [Rhodospirillaceae bacterium]|nr:ComF family protein [Rhodospirillaceae bacterium]
MHAPSSGPAALRRGAERLLDWVLPPQCLACGAASGRHGALCGDCWEQADFLTAPWCYCCGLPFELQMLEGALCGACLRDPPVFTRARAAMAYDELSRRMILGLKYGDRADMAPAFATWLGRAGSALIDEADWIAPVPLHWTRLFSRRFNQAAMLARLLARDAAKPFAPDMLQRRKRTPTQAGLSPSKRRRNVQGVFAVNHRWQTRIEGRRVLLIDDVLTTGATVTACTKVLLRAGASGVDVLTLARVVRSNRD